MDPRRAIGTAAASVDLVNQRGDARICNSAPRGRSLLPCVVASWGHAKPLTHGRDRERGLLRVDELEYIQRAHRPRSPSLAKKTAAFFQKIPFHAQRPILGPQAAQLLALTSGQAIVTPASVDIGLAHP